MEGLATLRVEVGRFGIQAAFVLRRGMELMPEWPLVAADPRPLYADPADHEEQMLALRTFMEYLADDPAGLLLGGVQLFLTRWKAREVRA